MGGAAGDAVFVRSIRGRRGGWYGPLGANPDGEVGDGAHSHPVCTRPAKYGDSAYVGPLLTEEAADATLRLEPRP